MSQELFKNLIKIPSISGNEEVFQKLVARELAPVSEVKYSDVLNNFTVQVGQGPEKIVLTAHADEVGFMVTYIDESGFIYFQPIGGIEADIAVGQPVIIQTQSGPINGIVGREEIWDTASAEENTTIVPYKQLWIDIGDNSKASSLVMVGDPVVYDLETKTLSGDYIMARGADDKLGVYVLIEVVRQLAEKLNPNISLFAVTTTQEEIGSRGAQPAVNQIQPRYSIILDTIAATDVPMSDKEEIGNVRLGEGVVISRGSNTHKDLFEIMNSIAQRDGIKFQVQAAAGATATDADPIQISGIGTATIVLGIPVRYSHFPGEIFHWGDVEQTIRLINAFLQDIKPSN